MKQKIILIVDDEPDVISYLSAILDEDDYGIHTADNAEDGLKRARELQPDLICLDIMMPQESGLSLYTKLRQDKRLTTTPVIIISGIESQQEFDFRRYVTDKNIPPPDRYIEKPIDVYEFVSVVDALTTSEGNESAGKRRQQGEIQ